MSKISGSREQVAGRRPSEDELSTDPRHNDLIIIGNKMILSKSKRSPEFAELIEPNDSPKSPRKTAALEEALSISEITVTIQESMGIFSQTEEEKASECLVSNISNLHFSGNQSAFSIYKKPFIKKEKTAKTSVHTTPLEARSP